MFTIPLDVPSRYRRVFAKNYQAITHNSGRLFLFAADHKFEQLNPASPEDFFVLADSGHIGAFATHLGLIARYGALYKNINYIVKLNSKTNIIPASLQDPDSSALWTLDQTVGFAKNSGLAIRGVGYTIYLGSEHETDMLAEAAQIVYQAHQHGLVAILWVYPRGQAVVNEHDVRYIVGAAGVATSLGADFVKVKVPHAAQAISSAQLLKQVVESAGNTCVLCSGGEKQETATFLRGLHEYLQVGEVAGAAIGRNIFEHDFARASKMVEACSALIYDNCTAERAIEIANG